ncbi:MAG TPA: hypothetical protein VJB60_02485 [Candidatus Peribacterales bacterium]|nr:hypothetical protein [Candidatus Peribacterales bacterium]
MTTISVPLNDEQYRHLIELLEDGIGVNKADVLRKALTKLAEDQAVERILRAEREPSLKGNLDDLMRKICP